MTINIQHNLYYIGKGAITCGGCKETKGRIGRQVNSAVQEICLGIRNPSGGTGQTTP